MIQAPNCWDPCPGGIFYLYRNAAELHNQAMMYIGTLPNFTDLKFNKAFAASLDFATMAYPTINVSAIITAQKAKVYFDKMQELNASDRQNEFPKFLYDQGLLNATQMQYYTQLIDTVIALQDKSPLFVPAAMLGLQNALIARSDLSSSDREMLYAISTGSVAIFNFWADAKLNKNNPWHEVAQGSNLPNWLKKGLADLGGFIVGAVVGTAIGGPPVGAAGGTLVGSACSSAVTAA